MGAISALGALRAEQDHFLAATPYLVPVADALSAVLVNDAIRAAQTSGGAVDVPQVA